MRSVHSIFLVLLSTLCLIFPPFLRAQFFTESRPTVVIINQVRGTECCDAGSLESFQYQLQALHALNLQATFALRYDALIDRQFTNLLKDSANAEHESAIFLEITPMLAKKAGVPYRGPESLWYKAANAYLLGYSVDDRKKLIDEVMLVYKQEFGTYPTTTVGWMIDAWSLRYLHDKYGVIAHEITREQWGTDSYTLLGGPPQGPYLPLTTWPLIPATKEHALQVMMLRQTITDPVWNYGDVQSVTTSQPNDYLRAKLTIT